METNFEPGYYWIKFPGQHWEIALCAGDCFFIPGDIDYYRYEEFSDIAGPISSPD